MLKRYSAENIDQAPYGFAVVELILDNKGVPVDFKLLEINQKLLQWSRRDPEKSIGKMGRAFLPGYPSEWLLEANRVVQEEIESSFPYFSSRGEYSYNIHLYPIKNRILGVMMDKNTLTAGDEKNYFNKKRSVEFWEERGLFYFWDWDIKTSIFHLSSKWLKRLGWGLMDDHGPLEKYLPIIHSMDRDMIERNFRDFAQSKVDTFSYEFRMIHANGDTFWVFVQGEIQLDVEGTPVRILGSLQDITERKNTESQLKAEEENFHTFFNTIDDMLIIGGPDGKILQTNQACLDQLAYSPEDLKRLDILDLFPKEKRSQAEKYFSEMFEGNRTFCPLPLVRKNGDPFPAETRVWFGVWNGKDCIFVMARDISSQWEAQQRFEKIFQKNPAVMLLANGPDWKISHVNQAFEKTLGYNAEEVQGRKEDEIKLFLYPEQQERLDASLREKKVLAPIEVGIRRKDGAPVYGIMSSDLFYSGGQETLLVVFVNTTERKMAEQALQRERELFSKGPVLILLLDGKESFPVRFVSANVFSILGYPPQEITHKQFRFVHLIHRDDRRQFDKDWDEITQARNDSFDQSLRLRTRSGEYKWFYCLFRVEWGISEYPDVLHGYIFDQTELKKAENTLARERLRLRETLEETARMNRLMMGREERIIEMKQEVNQLLHEMGKGPHYKSVVSHEE